MVTTGAEAADYLKGLSCLVLGAGGFLGRSLCVALCDAGAVVQGYGRMPDPRTPVDSRVIWTTAEFSDGLSLARAIQGQQIVFHSVGSSIPESSNHNPAEDILANIVPTVRLLDLCREEGVRKVIFSSSGGTIYGVPASTPTPEDAPTNPISAYGINKLAIEKYLALYRHLYGLEYHVLRLSNPYGPGQSPFTKQGVVAAMIYRILSHQPIEIWGTGEIVRDFVYVDDVARGFLSAARYSGPHRIMNLGSGQGTSINQIVNDLERVSGLPVQVRRTHGRVVDVPVSTLDTTLITKHTDWRPQVPWAAGLENAIAWMREAYGLATVGP